MSQSEHDIEKQPKDHVPGKEWSGPDKGPVFSSTDESALKEPHVVDWDGPDDPQNPMNWRPLRKNIAVVVAGALTLLTPLASTIFAPAVPQLLAEFNTHNDLLASFVVSVYVLGYGIGPFVVAPSSEVWGRTPVYHVANVLFVIFSIACAVSTNTSMFCVFRFFQGFAGSAPLTNGGATIGDIIPREKRGVYMSLWSLGPLLGPTVGPIIGGFLSQAKGWRWTFWLLTILSGFLTILSVFTLNETYAPVLLERKTRRLRKETGDDTLRSKLDTGLRRRDFFIRAFIRPTKLLFTSPIVILLSLMVSVSFSYIYLLLATFSFVFQEQYGFGVGVSGLTFLGIGVGLLSGLPFSGKVSDVYMAKKTAQNGGVARPEHRLLILILAPWFLAAGLFGYGWTAQEKVHWIAPIILSYFVGLGQIATYLPSQTYLVDAYGRYSASALAANTIMRSIFGALLPLAAQPMYNRLGLGWGNSLLAFIALATAPIPWLFLRYGEYLRTRFTQNL